MLFAVAYGDESVRAFFTRQVYDTVRISELIIYALMFGVYIFRAPTVLPALLPTISSLL